MRRSAVARQARAASVAVETRLAAAAEDAEELRGRLAAAGEQHMKQLKVERENCMKGEIQDLCLLFIYFTLMICT